MFNIVTIVFHAVWSFRAKLGGEKLVFGKHFVNVSVLPKQTDSFRAQTQSYGVGQAEGINAVNI